VDLQVLDNEYSKEYKVTMKDKWGVTYELVPPDIHRRNATERAVHTFKAHFLSMVTRVSDDFQRQCIDLLLPQVESTLNPLQAMSVNSKLLA
jgi:hypothetical protein